MSEPRERFTQGPERPTAGKRDAVAKEPATLPRPSVRKLLRRAVAVHLDLIPLGIMWYFSWQWLADGSRTDNEVFALNTAAGALILIAYYTLLESSMGMSFGKLLMGLRVIDRRTLATPDIGRVFVRNVLRPLDALFGYLIGWAAAVGSGQRQRIGDMAAGTVVVGWNFKKEIENARAEAQALQRRQRAGQWGEEVVSGHLDKLARYDSTDQAEYYVFNDLYEPRVGNIDHLVVGPAGIVVVETKSKKGLVSVNGSGLLTVDGELMERDALRQVYNQRKAMIRRMGAPDRDPRNVKGFDWIICFPRGRIDHSMAPRRSTHLATATDLRQKIKRRPAVLSPHQVRAMVNTVSKLYGKEPDSCPQTTHDGGAVNGNSPDGWGSGPGQG